MCFELKKLLLFMFDETRKTDQSFTLFRPAFIRFPSPSFLCITQNVLAASGAKKRNPSAESQHSTLSYFPKYGSIESRERSIFLVRCTIFAIKCSNIDI